MRRVTEEPHFPPSLPSSWHCRDRSQAEAILAEKENAGFFSLKLFSSSKNSPKVTRLSLNQSLQVTQHHLLGTTFSLTAQRWAGDSELGWPLEPMRGLVSPRPLPSPGGKVLLNVANLSALLNNERKLSKAG